MLIEEYKDPITGNWVITTTVTPYDMAKAYDDKYTAMVLQTPRERGMADLFMDLQVIAEAVQKKNDIQTKTKTKTKI